MALANSVVSSIIALPSAARTTTTISPTIENLHASSALVYARVTSSPGTAAGVDTLTATLECYDGASDQWFSALLANSVPTIDGTNSGSFAWKLAYNLGATQYSFTSSSQGWATIPAFLTRQLRVRMVHAGSAGTGSWTYSVGVHFTAS
ncbi:MAG: hypothetical protein EBS90_10805 [Betaproteobacteria bacterium]|nr:hypothetical protein [Betaproteobacteria bacterium]